MASGSEGKGGGVSTSTNLSKKTEAGKRNRNMIAKALRQERQEMSFPFK